MLHLHSGWPQVAPQRGAFTCRKAPLGLSVGCSLLQFQVELTLLLLFLMTDIFAHRQLIQPDRTHAVATRPEVHPLGPMGRHQLPMNSNRALPLQKSNHKREAELRRNLQTHVHVIWAKSPFQDFHTLLTTQVPQDSTHITTKFSIQQSPSILRNDHYVILAVPTNVR